MNDGKIIYAHELIKTFNGETAVDKLSLEVEPGVIFGFIGPSGCGKTTSVRMLLGIYAPDSGEVEVLQRPPQQFRRQEQVQIGYMPQQFVLYPELTVWENLEFAALLYGQSLRRKETTPELLELVELKGHEKKKVRDLSGGMQRRLSLAASIVHDPRLLFLDEPTAGIDPVLRRKFWDYFETLKQNGRTLFVTTQYVGEAAHCDQVGVMLDGRLIVVDSPEGLRRRALGGEIMRLNTASYLPEADFNRLRAQPFVKDGQAVRLRNHEVELVVEDASIALPKLISWCQAEDIEVTSASEYLPVFDDVFVELIKQETLERENGED